MFFADENIVFRVITDVCSHFDNDTLMSSCQEVGFGRGKKFVVAHRLGSHTLLYRHSYVIIPLLRRHPDFFVVKTDPRPHVIMYY